VSKLFSQKNGAKFSLFSWFLFQFYRVTFDLLMNRKLSVAELNRLDEFQYASARKFPVIIIADNIRSLSNIGAIFRTADAFRVERIILFGISACPPHREIHKTALGAEMSVPWSKCDTDDALLKDLAPFGDNVFCLEQTTKAVSLERMDFISTSKPLAIVIGNEVNGVSEFLVNRYSAIEIPQYGIKHSFNVSVSLGIALWEIYRQLGMRE
jgi:tRNA G18 (ribose-2'-O)-methylase SpoU